MTYDEWQAMCWQFPQERFENLVKSVYGGLTTEPLRRPTENTEERVA